METDKDFDIEFSGLKLGLHDFEYSIDNKFFEDYNFNDYNKINAQVKVSLTKKETLLELNFNAKGQVNINCDLTNESFALAVNNSFNIVVKFGTEHNFDNEEVLIIPYSDYKFNIKHYIYELVSLSIPQKRIHPGIKDGSLRSEILDKLEELSPKELSKNENRYIDPRWEKLKNLRTDK